MMTFHVRALYGNQYEDQFDMAIIHSASGEYAILDNHLPIIDHIQEGYIELRLNDSTQFLYVMDATFEFNQHKLHVVATDAQLSKNVESAKKTLEDTKSQRLQVAKAENIDFSKLEKDLFDYVKKAKSGHVS
jgi:F-type H+-transporting ATPase subunit epsilon